MANRLPTPLFNTLEHLPEQSALGDIAFTKDFIQANAFLLSYHGSEATFNAYRREVERLLQWAWLIAKKID